MQTRGQRMTVRTSPRSNTVSGPGVAVLLPGHRPLPHVNYITIAA